MNNTTGSALDWYNSLENDIEYQTEAKKIEFAFAISRRMEQLGMSKTDLATAASTSNAYITKVLRGDSNLTIESLVKFASAINGDLHIHISPKDAQVRWFEHYSNKAKEMENDALAWAKLPRNKASGTSYAA